MGVGWGVDGRALTDEDHATSMSWMSAELRALDLLTGGWRTWKAGPSARTLLPRATALPRLFACEPSW